MPSRTVTIVLALATILFGTLAGVQLAQDDLTSIFGTPPREVGEELYVFDRDEVHTVRISDSTGDEAVFEKQGGAWIMHLPTHDRADFRDLQRIVYFSRSLRVEDVIRRQDTSLEETGMRRTKMHRGRFLVKLANRRGEPVAEYRLGRRTAWHRLDKQSGETAQTFFVRPNEKAQKDYIYICSAPAAIKPSVRQILDRGFERLRDHRPFLFDPATLAEVTIRHRGGEIVLSRTEKSQPWRMTKPLESRTKPDTMAALLKGLYELEAVQVHNRGSVTIPPRPPEGYFLELELLYFDANGNRTRPRKLTVEPPSSDAAATVYATMDDRPAVIFELPLKTAKDRIGLAELPLAVDQLRGRTLASLDIRALRTLTIHSLGRPEPIQIFLGREGPANKRRWMVQLNGEISPASEVALGTLLHAVSRQEVIGYASDAATELATFGLSPPHKRLVLRGGEDEAIDLFFGRGNDGKFYAMRRASSTVAEITPETFSAIAARPFDWRDTLLMPFSIVDLAVMKIETPIRPPLADPALTLNYSFLDETWTARQFDEDATARLDPSAANELIAFLEDLRVERWLSETSPAAERALRHPTFRFTAMFREVDDAGDRVGVREASFDLAPASRSASNRYFYGRLAGDPHYFLLGIDTYRELTRPLMEGD